jgi:predicted Rossmann fold nucleotide-binding protein DprA/Smf involved in DNA uptake
MKVIIAGSRTFKSYERLCKVCDHMLQNQTDITIISGTAKGADKLGEKYALERGYGIELFPADWNNFLEPCVVKLNSLGKKYNALAGHNRNRKMAEHSDALICFWDGKSSGTKNMIDIAKSINLKIHITLV